MTNHPNRSKTNLTIRKGMLGVAFSSASGMRVYLPRAVVRLVALQPGYTSKTKICLSRTDKGGIRLFAHTTGDSRSGEWMDASLQDLQITISPEGEDTMWPMRDVSMDR